MATFKYLIYINFASILLTIWVYNLAMTEDFAMFKAERMSPLITQNPLIVYSSKFLGGTSNKFLINSSEDLSSQEITPSELGVDQDKAFFSDPSFYFFNVFSVIAPLVLVVISLAGAGPILLLLALQIPTIIVSVFSLFWAVVVIQALINLFRG
ncbi:MAG: hypothetical protein QW051_04840 [Candidatus Aenigmatarchaeota archaeon]